MKKIITVLGKVWHEVLTEIGRAACLGIPLLMFIRALKWILISWEES